MKTHDDSELLTLALTRWAVRFRYQKLDNFPPRLGHYLVGFLAKVHGIPFPDPGQQYSSVRAGMFDGIEQRRIFEQEQKE